ncbi:PDR/VanB family oxidoreductase [Pseudomonas brassicacearum]|uniref:PDR/VanB family oxidoreductase n=1 Tax=Pseudomonas brassicacearum TaxID=930166 RepID=UPI001D2ACC3D|nr:PDR/VanB family oxidoreductase [Pseudomonas brassicacearum]CAH0156914.1 Phthalate 4,5-dioxygenase oxygenase reductase subunit [Pseudomonas brassicacearum]
MVEAIVLKKTLAAVGIYCFELARADGGALSPFTAGAHIDVHLPNGLVRQYSLCNSAQEQHRYEIAVLLDPASRGGSKAVHELLQQGTRLLISEPRNLFALEPEAKRSYLFAGGIGITPILCMAQRLSKLDAPFEMHYCNRSQSRAAFVDRIQASDFAGNVSFYYDDEGQRLNSEAVLNHYVAGDHLYVCGPLGFLEFILSEASRLGWPEHSLHREYFAAPAQSAADAGSFEVRLYRTGQSLLVPAGRTVAEVLLDAGIDIPLSCEQGICGTCLTRVLEGEPDHRDMFLTDVEHARNDQFTPCCSRAKSPVLVLDL